MRFAQKLLLDQFDVILQKALKATSKQIKERLSCEIRKLGRNTTGLETSTDELQAGTTHIELDLEAAKEENKALALRLEDAKNRSHR